MTNRDDDDGKTDADRFRDLARELGCDQDLEAIKAKLQKIARAPKLERVPIDAISPSGRRRKAP